MSLKLRNIIAMEDADFEEVPAEIAESAVDEVEAVEATEEIVQDSDIIEEFNTELDETVEDVQELEATEETLETALEDPEYEGLDEVSAEMIGQRLRSLSKRRGFDVDRLEGVFSKESFNSSTSGRRRKTEIAMEGIKDAIVNMWERIKAAVKAVWNAIKDFWKKHISTLGRLLKSLEKTKRRVRDINGSPDSTKEVKPSSSLQRAFYAKNNGDIDINLINTYNERQKTALNFGLVWMGEAAKVATQVPSDIEKVIAIFEKHGATSVKSKREALKNEGMDPYAFTRKELNGMNGGSSTSQGQNTIKSREEFKEFAKILTSSFESGGLGTEETPLVNGWFITVDDTGLDEENPTVEFKWDQREVKPSDKRKFQVGSKDSMVKSLDNAIALIKETQRFGANFDKVSRDFDKASNKITQTINKALNETDDSDLRTLLNASMRIFNECARLIPKINTKVVGLNATYAKQLISYCNTSAANYKES